MFWYVSNEKETGAHIERGVSGSSWRLYFRGAWLNAVSVGGLVWVLVVTSPPGATDDFGPAGMGFIFAAWVAIPWFTFSLLVGGPVVLLMNAASSRPAWIALCTCFLSATLAALAVPVLWQLVVGSMTLGQAFVFWVLLPLLSGGCWAFVIARRVLPRGGLKSALRQATKL